MTLCSIWTASALVKFIMLDWEWIVALLITTYFQRNIIDSPLCICGTTETTKHYLFDCNRFYNLRQEMMQSISQLCEATLMTLLYGVTDLSDETNGQLFVIIQEYVIRTKRLQKVAFK